MAADLTADNGGQTQQDCYCQVLTIWRDDLGEIQCYVDQHLSVEKAADKLANYPKNESKVLWVHMYGNDPNRFEVLRIRPHPRTKYNVEKFLLDRTGPLIRETLRRTFHDLLDPPGQQASDTRSRNRGKAVTKSKYFKQSTVPGCVVFMPVAQYQCSDQNQNQRVATADKILDIISRLRDGEFKDLPKEDQLWAVHGQNLVLTSTPYPRRGDIFHRLLSDIDTGCILRSDLPLDSTGMFCLVLRRCICNHSDFLEAAQAIVDEASTAGVNAFADLYFLLEKLPEPENEAYDSDLRKLINQLIRISEEIRWLNVLFTVLRNVSIFLNACEDQHNARESLAKAAMDEPQFCELVGKKYMDKLESWQQASGNRLKELRRMHHDQIRNAQAQMIDLFEFKQSISDILSSQFQLRQADASTRSGSIIMYFTMMTILFSSLSFMAAFFAINIRSFPRNDQGDVELSMSYVASRIAAWSIAIAVPFWLLAAFLNPMANFLNWLLPGWLSPAKVPRDMQYPKTQKRGRNAVWAV